MAEKILMYSLTFIGLYLELAGAFLLSAEAIGIENLHKITCTLRKHRTISFIILAFIIIVIALLSKLFQILHLLEAIILVVSLGVVYDFAPRIIDTISKRHKRGTLGLIGFILFSLGFVVQAYVNLSLLY